MTDQAKAFFAENPGVDFVWQVGTDIFLAKHEHHAKAHAKQFGLEHEKVENPDKPIEEEDDEFEKLVGGEANGANEGEEGEGDDDGIDDEVASTTSRPDYIVVDDLGDTNAPVFDRILDKVGGEIKEGSDKLHIVKKEPVAKKTKVEKL